jgi:hypothetical protein
VQHRDGTHQPLLLCVLHIASWDWQQTTLLHNNQSVAQYSSTLCLWCRLRNEPILPMQVVRAIHTRRLCSEVCSLKLLHCCLFCAVCVWCLIMCLYRLACQEVLHSRTFVWLQTMSL